MYAVIKTGGKQYKVSPGDILKVETLEGNVGDSINFDSVCMIADGEDVTIGTPEIAGAQVAASVVSHGRHKKVEIIKFKRRKHHQKRTGHRQNFTEIEIESINGKGAIAKKKVAPAKKKAVPKKETAKAEPKKAAPKKAAPKKAAPAKKPAAKKATTDKLTKIEGIGPKIASVLNEGGINTFAKLGKASVADVQKILDEAEGNFKAHKPDTWPEQSQMAADGKWDELKKWQDELDGGKVVK